MGPVNPDPHHDRRLVGLGLSSFVVIVAVVTAVAVWWAYR